MLSSRLLKALTLTFACAICAVGALADDIAKGPLGARAFDVDATLDMTAAPIGELFDLFHDMTGVRFVVDPSVSGKASLHIKGSARAALESLARSNGLSYVAEGDAVRVNRRAAVRGNPRSRRP